MKKNLFLLISWLMLIPVQSGCNDSDDVAVIFTGKNWKLNYITVDGGHEMFDFWGTDQTGRTKSYQELEKKGSYNLVFEGVEEGDKIQGNINGTVVANFALTGKWSANGKNNQFKATVQGNDGGDKLAKNFLEGINNATSYEGDDKNLYLLYKPKSSKQTFRMVFYPIINNK